MGTWPETQCLKDRWDSCKNTLKHSYNDSCYLNTESKKEYFNNLSSARLMRVPLQRPVSRKKIEGQESGCSLPFETNYFLHPGQHLRLTICHLLSKVSSEVLEPGGQLLVHSDQAHFEGLMKSAPCSRVARTFNARLAGTGCEQFASPMFWRSKTLLMYS